MSRDEAPPLINLEDSPIWKETSKLVEHMYTKLVDFPEDEKWVTENKMRNASNDLLFGVAEAIGDSSPAATEYAWSHARKYAMSLKAIYRFAGRQHFIELEPEIIVRLDKLIKEITAQVKSAYAQTKATHQAEIEHMKKTYRIQKEEWS